jgi:hypothetical protein
MVLLAPNPDWIRTLPGSKLPDRTDFTRYGTDLQTRIRAWSVATSKAGQLAEEYAGWLERPDITLVHHL